MFLENGFMETYGLSSKTHCVYCTCATSFSFNFDWSYPMTRVSFGGQERCYFFLSFASSFMWCGQLFQDELYIVTIFTFKEKLGQKSRNFLDQLQYFQYSLTLHLNVIFTAASTSTPNFALA